MRTYRPRISPLPQSQAQISAGFFEILEEDVSGGDLARPMLAWIEHKERGGSCADRPSEAVFGAVRGKHVRNAGLSALDRSMQEFLLGNFSCCAANGSTELATAKLKDHLTAEYGTMTDARSALGDLKRIRNASIAIQGNLFRNCAPRPDLPVLSKS